MAFLFINFFLTSHIITFTIEIGDYPYSNGGKI